MFRSARKRRRSFETLSIESLENRAMMSADLGLAVAEGIRQIEWNGHQIAARADAWVVRAAPTTTAADLGVAGSWRATSLGEGFFSLAAPGASTQDVVGWASHASGVSYVEPDYAINPTGIPNDPSFSSLWGLRNSGQSGGVVGADIHATTAWNTTTGSRNVVVAVIDTGVDYTHPDLAANVWTNTREIAGDGVDNDGNGYVDDVRGWDFANNDANPMDDNGHGTHVSGTIGAVGNNGVGVTGVNWQVSILPLKFLTGSGSGSTSGAISAVNYATRMRRDFGINIVASNNSWGGGGYSTALRDAIDNGGRAGILFVAAAGNEAKNTDITPAYPASYDNSTIISVAATDRFNNLASFSNYGATSVDVAAPGVSILSTVPNAAYATYSGTSMATPHVTGAVALLAAAHPEATAAQLRSTILGNTTPVATLTGRVATGGLLNVAAALERFGSTTTPTPTPTPTPNPTPTPTLGDAGDKAATAMAIAASTRLAGRVGDGSSGARDVDLYRVTLQAGQNLIIDIDARSLATRSTLDSYLRLFSAAGKELARNDDYAGSFDSYLSFTASAAGTYYVGVSGYKNSTYNPLTGVATKNGSTGDYEVAFSFGSSPAKQSAGTIRTLGFSDPQPTVASLPAPRPLAFAAFAADYSLDAIPGTTGTRRR